MWFVVMSATLLGERILTLPSVPPFRRAWKPRTSLAALP